MLKIRLTRVGKKNSPSYRVVVAESKKAVKRKFVEILGNYNPTTQPKTLVIDKERSTFWISRGAQPSDTVHNLMATLGIVEKKINKVYGKPVKKKDKGKEKEEPKAEVATTETKTEEPTPEEPTVTDETVTEEKSEPETTEAEAPKPESDSSEETEQA
ncbi:MAG TPA: 30S ribosomal protein S16 [bacterium]|nr:30S ribosomal protein S16 [bacterium]